MLMCFPQCSTDIFVACEDHITSLCRAVAPTTACTAMAVLVFPGNHASIRMPHPCKLRVGDCVVVTRVRFLAKNAPRFLISLTNPLTSISSADLSEKQAGNYSLFSVRLVQTMTVVTIFTSRPRIYCVICMNAVKIGCVNGCAFLAV